MTLRRHLMLALITSAGLPRTAQAQDAGPPLNLPAPAFVGSVSVEKALRQRRSVREFAAAPLTFQDVAQLLWAAQGVTHPKGFRTAPSAGALAPLDIYLVAGDVTGLPAGLYRYLPSGHALAAILRNDLRGQLLEAALGQFAVGQAPALLVIAGTYQRTAGRYGNRAERYVHMEAGHVSQCVYLQATARGLATVLIGAFDDQKVHEALSLPTDQAPLALMPVGRLR
jgi:SagB-type dehydrogenase family enzyme